MSRVIPLIPVITQVGLLSNSSKDNPKVHMVYFMGIQMMEDVSGNRRRKIVIWHKGENEYCSEYELPMH